MKNAIIATALIVTVTGCASQQVPAPVIDRKGLAPGEYATDLRECRKYANGQATAGQGATGGAIAGAIVGALLGAALGDSSLAQRGAGMGAVYGGAQGATGAAGNRENIVKNCLRGRGYSVLN